MPTSIIMCGAAGRMGQMILQGAAEDDSFSIAGGTEYAESPAVGKNIGDLIGKPEIDAPVKVSLAEIPNAKDAVPIHFSSPEATIDQLKWSVDNNVPAVIGTTGLTADQRVMVEEAAKSIPIVFAPNMSVGVNTLFKIVGDLTRILGEAYDVEITEIHHRFKKDSPSGTARRLGEVVCEARGVEYEDVVVDGRTGLPGERPQGEIGMHALRGGDVVGEHTVTFATLGERVEISHRAHSRETFAHGALRAAQWLEGKEPGFYTMQDVLGIK
ncbi:MAG: 4-hydroxy-tetrahydrodipicolinate reductase [Candidatus Sumerlaeia bacterium]